MTAIWIAGFSILTVIVLVMVAVLIAVLRQLGDVYERLETIGSDSEPPRRRVVPVPEVEVIDPPGAAKEYQPFTDEITVIGYVAPGCAGCERIPDIIHRFLPEISETEDLSLVLASEVGIGSARQFAEKHRITVPMIRGNDLGIHLGIRETPYFIVARRSDEQIVLQAGAFVQEEKQLSDLLDFARSEIDKESESRETNGRDLSDELIPMASER